MSEIIVGITALNRRLDAISGPAMGRDVMGRLQLRTIAAMKTNIKHKTSHTSRTIRPGTLTATSATVTGSQNVLWLDTGTRPHVIRPRTKKALRWAASPGGRRLSGRPTVAAQRGEKGGLRFATVVHHPGTRAQPFIDASVREALNKSGLTTAVVERWNGAA